MLKLNQKEVSNQNGLVMPIMFVHRLRSDKYFNGELVDCYVTQMDNDRYAVFSSIGNTATFYKVMQNKEEMDNCFDEVV